MEKLCLTRSEEQNSEFDSAEHHQRAVTKNWKSKHPPNFRTASTRNPQPSRKWVLDNNKNIEINGGTYSFAALARGLGSTR
jgi:hypothetical protein